MKPDEYPALTSGMFSILASLPDVPRHPGARVSLADLSRWLPEAVRAEEEAREARLNEPPTFMFALEKPIGNGSAQANKERVWTPEMRARLAEAQRRRGIRQRAEKAAEEAVERGEPIPEDVAAALALTTAKPTGPCRRCEELGRQCDPCYRRELRERRKEAPRPTTVVCEICKEAFRVSGRGFVAKYCSKTCQTKAMNAKEKAARDAERLARVPKECLHCGEPINRDQSKGARWAKFCGNVCRKRYRRAQAACRGHVPSICIEEGCRVPINEGFNGWGNYALRCPSCRKEVKKRRNREAYAKKRGISVRICVDCQAEMEIRAGSGGFSERCPSCWKAHRRKLQQDRRKKKAEEALREAQQ